MKYLELFKDGFDETLVEKVKPENWPYVGYSPNEGLRFSIIPNEDGTMYTSVIIYTTTDGSVLNIRISNSAYPDEKYTNAVVKSNTYGDQGEIIFEGDVTYLGGYRGNVPYAFMEEGFFGGLYSVPEGFDSSIYYSKIKTVTLPNTLLEINKYAFCYCKNLLSINFEGTVEEWDAISKEEGWNSGVPATYVQCSDGQVAL